MTDSEQAVGLRIKRICVALDQMRTRDIADMELTSSQAFVLGYLVSHRDEALCSCDVAKRFGLRPPTVSGILSRLESKGFLVSCADDDRRRKRITVTEKAERCFSDIRRRIEENEARITASMTPEQQAQLCRLLDLVQKNIEAEASEPCCGKEARNV